MKHKKHSKKWFGMQVYNDRAKVGGKNKCESGRLSIINDQTIRRNALEGERERDCNVRDRNCIGVKMSGA
jgi:hypothetical protein